MYCGASMRAHGKMKDEYEDKPLSPACAVPLFWLLIWNFVAPQKLHQLLQPNKNRKKELRIHIFEETRHLMELHTHAQIDGETVRLQIKMTHDRSMH